MRQTISSLCNLINGLENTNCLNTGEKIKYQNIMKKFNDLDKELNEVRTILPVMLSEVEWNYPLDYSIAIDKVIAALGPKTVEAEMASIVNKK